VDARGYRSEKELVYEAGRINGMYQFVTMPYEKIRRQTLEICAHSVMEQYFHPTVYTLTEYSGVFVTGFRAGWFKRPTSPQYNRELATWRRKTGWFGLPDLPD
jgi:hypothetical protein